MTAIAFAFSIHAATAVLAATSGDSAPETVPSSEADRLYYLNRWAQPIFIYDNCSDNLSVIIFVQQHKKLEIQIWGENVHI